MKRDLHLGQTTAVVDSMGGELISWKDSSGKEYLWSGDPAYWVGRGPVLFPIVGALREDKAVFDGTSYTISKHGFAKKSEFTLLDATESRITFELKDNEDTLKVYPYRFSLQISHTLEEKGFRTEYKVISQDTKPMPFCIGGHQGFACPLNKGTSFEEYGLLFDTPQEVRPYNPDNQSLLHRGDPSYDAIALTDENSLPLRYQDFDGDALIFENIRSRKITLFHETSGPLYDFTFEGFPALGIWTPSKKNAPFLCLEPWAGLPDDHNASGIFTEKPYVTVLSPGEVFQASYAMTLR